MNRRRKDATQTKKIAVERMEILLTKADTIYSEDAILAQKYGEQARKIAMKAKVKIPRRWRFRFCRQCKRFLYPGINAHVRTKAGKPSRVITYCNFCQTSTRAIILNE